ncbi:hypothetical protein D3C72_1970810 [compost metagenome]
MSRVRSSRRRQSRSRSAQLMASGSLTKLPYCASGFGAALASSTTNSGSYSRSSPHGLSGATGSSSSGKGKSGLGTGTALALAFMVSVLHSVRARTPCR